MSPILVRPVREQLEHDRIIRLLQVRLRRRYDAITNPGTEQNAPVRLGQAVMYPDLVLFSPGRGRKLQAVIEVETGESVNHLEALAQWAHFARLRAPFFLYVPAAAVDVTRRLCDDNQIAVNEIWSYHSIGDQVRFTIIHRGRVASVARPGRRRVGSEPVSRPAARRSAKAGPPAKGPARKARLRKRR
jgi:hypothetical protein